MAQKVMRVRPASFPAQLARLAFRDLWVLRACGQKQRVKMAQRGLLVLLVLRGLPALRDLWVLLACGQRPRVKRERLAHQGQRVHRAQRALLVLRVRAVAVRERR